MKKRLPENLRAFTRALRVGQTDAEHALWSLLRNRQLCGYKFRRQHPIGKYVLDFYCHGVSLAVELDGGQHNEQTGVLKDGERTEFLKSVGIEVIRFWNNEVLRDPESVLERILLELEERFFPHPRPSPGGRGE